MKLLRAIGKFLKAVIIGVGAFFFTCLCVGLLVAYGSPWSHTNNSTKQRKSEERKGALVSILLLFFPAGQNMWQKRMAT